MSEYDAGVIKGITELYLELGDKSEEKLLVDALGRKVEISLRNLSIMVDGVIRYGKLYGIKRGVYEGGMLGFGCLLGREGRSMVEIRLRAIIGVGTQWYEHCLGQIQGCAEN